MDQKEQLKYWQEWTGNKGHGQNDSTFINLHQSRVRINYTYYNSKELMLRIVNWYDKIDPDGVHFDYSIMDDGSQVIPITDFLDKIPDHWDVYRIEKDHGWNNEGARNMLMQATTNTWNLMLDSDWVVTRRNLVRIKEAVNSDWLRKDICYMPGSYGWKTLRNSYLVTWNEFWNRGGYDQSFVGYQGNDYSFLKYDAKYDWSDWFRFSKIVNDVVDPEDKNRLEAVKQFHLHMLELEEQGFGYRNKEDKQDFIWTNEEERLKRRTVLEYVQVQ